MPYIDCKSLSTAVVLSCVAMKTLLSGDLKCHHCQGKTTICFVVWPQQGNCFFDTKYG